MCSTIRTTVLLTKKRKKLTLQVHVVVNAPRQGVISVFTLPVQHGMAMGDTVAPAAWNMPQG